jgi:hypothetical protein
MKMEDLSFKPDASTLEESWGLGVTMARSFLEHEPHEGYAALLELAQQSSDFFVVTSNIDGYFKRSAFPTEQLWETHGCMDTLQCTTVGQPNCCGVGTWPFNEQYIPQMRDGSTSCPRAMIPVCGKCGALARPNVSHSTGFHYLYSLASTLLGQLWFHLFFRQGGGGGSACSSTSLEVDFSVFTTNLLPILPDEDTDIEMTLKIAARERYRKAFGAAGKRLVVRSYVCCTSTSLW